MQQNAEKLMKLLCRKALSSSSLQSAEMCIRDRIQAKLSVGDSTEPSIPGNRPYKKAGGAGMVPKPTKECTKCGLCAAECPVQAIDKENPKKINEKACISCMRCISVCPHSARKVNPVMLSAVGLVLKKVCSERKDCELFL